MEQPEQRKHMMKNLIQTTLDICDARTAALICAGLWDRWNAAEADSNNAKVAWADYNAFTDAAIAKFGQVAFDEAIRSVERG